MERERVRKGFHSIEPVGARAPEAASVLMRFRALPSDALHRPFISLSLCTRVEMSTLAKFFTRAPKRKTFTTGKLMTLSSTRVTFCGKTKIRRDWRTVIRNEHSAALEFAGSTHTP